jgi:hypothetical protein
MSITYIQKEHNPRAQTSFQMVQLVSGVLDELMKITERIPIEKSNHDSVQPLNREKNYIRCESQPDSTCCRTDDEVLPGLQDP